MAHLFGLHPWDVDRLTQTEFNAFLDWANEYNKPRSKP